MRKSTWINIFFGAMLATAILAFLASVAKLILGLKGIQ